MGASIIRTVQKKIYPDTQIFGMILTNNTNSLMSANKTGRKGYSQGFKFRGTEEKIISAMDARSDRTLENVSIKNRVGGIHERTLHEIYRNSAPPFVAKVENVGTADFFISKIDRLITSIHYYVSKMIEKTLIVY